MHGTHLTLGSILVFFSLRHFSAHRSQFGCVIPDLDKNRNPFNCRLSSVKSSPKAPGAEIRFLWTEREMFAKTTPFTPAGTTYQKGVWVEKKDIDRWMDRVSAQTAVRLSWRTVNATISGRHPRTLTLSPPRFLLHQYTLMKGNAHATNPVMLHTKTTKKKKITTWCAVIKKRSRTKAAKFKRGASISPPSN